MEQIIILAENRCAVTRGLIAEHGFSALIEIDGFRLLFDTGQGFALRQNPALLAVNLSKIDALVLSHGHYDHTGGVSYVLEKNPHLKIYLHPSALLKRKVKRRFGDQEIEVEIGIPISQKEMEEKGAELIFLENPVELAEGRILITGTIPLKVEFEKPEQGFFVEKDGELVPDDFADDFAIAVRGKKGDASVIFGCAHRGAINSLRRIEELWGIKKLDAVLGGMHLFSRSKEQVSQTLEELARFNPGRIAVGHCTGEMIQFQIAQKFSEKFIFPASGLKINLE